MSDPFSAKRERIVEVEWEDSLTTHGWQKEDELPHAGPVYSVGYVWAEDENEMLLVESIAQFEQLREGVAARRAGCAMAIPKSAVRKVTELHG